MPEPRDHEKLRKAIGTGRLAAEHAGTVRASLRRRTEVADEERQAELEATLAELREVMRPLRRALGKLIWEPIPLDLEDELREVSAAIQYERRQLSKMLRSTEDALDG